MTPRETANTLSQPTTTAAQIQALSPLGAKIHVSWASKLSVVYTKQTKCQMFGDHAETCIELRVELFKGKSALWVTCTNPKPFPTRSHPWSPRSCSRKTSAIG